VCAETEEPRELLLLVTSDGVEIDVQPVLTSLGFVHAGEVCHRRWFDGWFEDRYGIVVPEVRDVAEVIDIESVAAVAVLVS
jgi:hypothetical protein